MLFEFFVTPNKRVIITFDKALKDASAKQISTVQQLNNYQCNYTSEERVQLFTRNWPRVMRNSTCNYAYFQLLCSFEYCYY